MAALSKKEIAIKIADELGESRKVVAEAMDMFLNIIKDEVAKGERVTFKGFGSFKVKQNAARTINPFGKGERVIPAAKKVKFIPSKNFNG